MSEIYSAPASDYTFLTQYNTDKEVPILKPNLVSPHIVAQVRQMQMMQASNSATPYASYNTLDGAYCKGKQDSGSAYQTIGCAYAKHTVPFQALTKVMPQNSLPRVTARLQMQAASQPQPSWYWDNQFKV